MPVVDLAPAPAAPVLPALRIGPLEIASPVVLAPMAGITNRAFRRLCRESSASTASGRSALYVNEMVTSRALVERHPETLRLIDEHAVTNYYAVPPLPPRCGCW